MNLNAHGLLFVAFAMGAGSTLIAERLLISSPDGVLGEQAAAKETPTEEIAPKPSWLIHATSSDDDLDRLSTGAVSTGNSDRPPSAASANECEPASQQEKSVQQYYNLAEGDELDPTLREERYAFDAGSKERENLHIAQEAILTMEEETNLYEPPPDDYKMSAEEQDAAENDSMNNSMSVVTAEVEKSLHQVLENEARTNTLYEDQDIIGLDEEEE